MIARLGSGLLLGWVVLHWAAIGLRTVPPNPVSAGLGPVVAPYVETVFDQHWMLFAPDPPTTDRRFEVRCDEGPWRDPAAPILAAHHRWRISWHGEEVRLYAEPGRELAARIDALAGEVCPIGDSWCPQRKLDRLMASAPVQQGNALARRFCGDAEQVRFRIRYVAFPPADGSPAAPTAVFEGDPVRTGPIRVGGGG